MKFFLHPDGRVFAFEDGTPLEVIHELRPTLVAISYEEACELVLVPEPVLTAQGVKAIVTAFRWEVETCGITLPAGVHVATGIDDQNRIASVVASAERSGLAEFDFKSTQGFVRMTLADLQDLAAVVARHVQACFSAERAHHEAIDALVAQHQDDPQALQAALDGYDESQGWPSVDLSQAEA